MMAEHPMTRKKRGLCIAVIVVLLLIGLGAVSLYRLVPSYSRVLEANWGVELPAKALLKLEYEQDSGASFHGDGMRFHIYSYKYEDYIDLMFAWIPGEPETLYHPTAREAAESWLSEIDVPQGQRPDYAACSVWYKAKSDNSELLIFRDSEKNLLYVLENLL